MRADADGESSVVYDRWWRRRCSVTSQGHKRSVDHARHQLLKDKLGQEIFASNITSSTIAYEARQRSLPFDAKASPT